MGTTLRLHAAGLDLAADAYGPPDAPPVLLFHGGGQTRHSWDGTARMLGDAGWRATTVDLRGHGDSDWSPDGGYGLDTFAADVRALARAAGAAGAEPVLVGASLGGLASLVAIADADDPAAVARGLVLVDVAPRLEPEGIARIGEFMVGHLDGFASLEEVADAVAAYNPHRPRPKDLSGLRKNVRLREDGRWHWHWDPAFVGGGGPIDEPRSYTNEDRLEAAAATLALPTLLVRGRQSDVLSEEGARQLLALVPHARYVDVGGAGHMVAGDRNDAFNDAVRGFLDSLPSD
ncbi:MAG TPA: alpha/beta hydrolase [Acidimicrobiales bacterium]|nr:alpha/beta hydrolase [Acidimicrobiales bacterium]